MLYLPQGAGYSARVVGMDPGTDTLGLAVITFNVNTLEIISTEATTLVGSKMSNKQSWLAEIHGDRYNRINALENRILDTLREQMPMLVGCESPFFNPGRPIAFGALTEIVNAIRRATWDYDRWVILNLVDPPSVKNTVGVKGNAKKEVVQEAVVSLAPRLRYVGTVPITQLDEHSIDAIAVALSLLNTYLEDLCLKLNW